VPEPAAGASARSAEVPFAVRHAPGRRGTGAGRYATITAYLPVVPRSHPRFGESLERRGLDLVRTFG
jgi:hypothetical protein